MTQTPSVATDSDNELTLQDLRDQFPTWLIRAYTGALPYSAQRDLRRDRPTMRGGISQIQAADLGALRDLIEAAQTLDRP